MAGSKRTAKQREKDKAFVAKLYVQSYTMRQIAEILNKANADDGLTYTISYVQVAYDVKQLLNEWQKDRKATIDKYMDRELAKLDAIENEMWRMWIKSCDKNITTKTSTNKKSDSEYVEVVESDGVGDPRYMTIILKCIDQRRDIVGYGISNALPAAGGAADSSPAISAGMTDEDYEKERQRIYNNIGMTLVHKTA